MLQRYTYTLSRLVHLKSSAVAIGIHSPHLFLACSAVTVCYLKMSQISCSPVQATSRQLVDAFIWAAAA